MSAKEYFRKMLGAGKSPPLVTGSEIFWSWVGSFLGVALVAYLDQFYFDPLDLAMIIGSFGASAVLIYGAITSPLAQPRNLLGGHVISAVVGVFMYQTFTATPWLAAALAVSVSIVAMHATKTLHPPGGATALIAVLGTEEIHALGYLYALIPAGVGALLMLVVALLVNNIPRTRRYPVHWW